MIVDNTGAIYPDGNRFSVRSLFGTIAAKSTFNSDRQLISGIRREAERLTRESETNLVEECNQLRRAAAGGLSNPELWVRSGGLVAESLRRTHSINLYDVQLLAGLAMCRGRIAEMQTGEGKTFSGMFPTFVFALPCRGVHVCTPNSYLASRDQALLRDAFSLLGVTTAVRNESDGFDLARRAYDADVTYAAGQLFGFDYLRDQWTRRQAAGAPLGQRTLQSLRGSSLESQLRERGLFAAVIDEADHVLIDDATSPLLITSAADRPAPDASLHLAAHSIAAWLGEGKHFVMDRSTGMIGLSDEGFHAVYMEDELATSDLLARPWHDYVIAALKAKHLLHAQRNYVVEEGKVQIVEQSTGRIFKDRTWSDGLHQAVQAKEKLHITAETESQGRITRQAFFQFYQHVCGMTGTASSCRRELKSIYALDVTSIPTRLPSKRELLATIACLSLNEKFEAIANETRCMIDLGRPVLVGTNHIEQSFEIARQLQRLGIDPRVLNGIQSQSEADIIALAGQSQAVTVATHLAGRGTDIPLDDASVAAGGLHVIACEHHQLARVDRQLIGRGARQGDPGTARFFVSPDDEFISRYAPYLATAVVRANSSPAAIEVLSEGIAAVQRRMESDGRKSRAALMKQNARPSDALAGLSITSLSRKEQSKGFSAFLWTQSKLGFSVEASNQRQSNGKRKTLVKLQ